MRKITGYIGALIVVVALMGSILAGYALNINGQSVVVNEYENVTDVSGLYSHTDQKTYIDYNPASNYIGYSAEQSGPFTINNPNGAYHDLKYQVYKSSITGKWNNEQSPSGAYYDNNDQVVAWSSTASQAGLTVYRVAMGENFTAYSYAPDGTNATLEIRIWNNGTLSRYWSQYITFSFDGSTVTLYFNSNTYTTPSSWFIAPSNTGDYVTINNNTGYYQQGEGYKPYDNDTPSTPVNEWAGKPTFNFYSYTSIYSNSDIFVPAVFTYNPVDMGMGINYTASNRVNNYPVIVNPANTSTTYSTINLQNISATDYWPNGNNGTALGPGIALNYLKEIDGNNVIWEWYTQMPHLVSYSNNPNVAPVLDESGLHSYRLSDILNSYSMPANTRTLTIDFNSGTTKNISENTHNQYYNVNLDYNFAGVIEIAQNKSNNSFILVNDVIGQKDYIVYDVERRTATVYDYNGVAKRTDSPDNILIGFDKVSTAIYSVVGVYSTALMAGFAPFYIDTSDRPQPTMNITALSVDPGEIDYIDITKGYSIKSNNVSDVIWNNEYENGNIQLLFRSLDTSETYHNTLTISGNTIDVDYIASKFYVSLNGDDAVNIGTWRNIILNIDLENGTLNAIPVRTFNSFTNVQMDNAVIPIGELVSAAPTNTITWSATPNSLLFNVYLTSVFMDTYGVVMADPTLNITDYFTNLDNFYRLKLSKFSVIGDSITINGQTYPVSDNTVTINNKTLQIKDVYITYADGHAYIEDSNSTIDLGEITSNIISMAGAWYFETYLEKGYTQLKQIYTWDWSDFILDNTQFCIFYIGLAVAGLIVAKRFCSMSVIDYAVFIISIVIALGVQVIA